MEDFVVSARKYRPATFDTVVGQSHITTTLKNAIATNHLAQAFLFCGPRGVGKTTCARILAKTANCQNLTPEVEACGQCDSCVSFANNASINIHELDAASNNSVDDIRSLTDQVRYPPQTGRYKIYIIDEVHMLSTAAFNAFLKTLEEPPPYAIFILATTEKHKILPTILSRCQIFDFNRIQPKDITDHLAKIAEREGIKAEPEALELIAQKADGGLRDALSMFDLNVTFSTDQTLRYKEVLNNLHILDYDYYFKIVDTFLSADLPGALILFDEVIRKGFDGHQFVGGLMEHLRNLLVCKDPKTAVLLQVSDAVKAKFIEQSNRCSASFLLSALSVVSQCDQQYKMARNHRLHVELCLMKLAHINAALSLSSQNVDDDSLKKKVVESTSEPSLPQRPTPQTESVIDDNRTTVIPKSTPTIQRPATPKFAGGLKSVRAILEAAEKPEKPVDPNGTAQPTTVTNTNLPPLTAGELPQVMADFLRKRADDGLLSSTEEVALSREIAYQNGVMSLVLDNELQLDKINEIKADILAFLRERFTVEKFSIEARVAPTEVKRGPYTPKEKFEFLAAKNEHLIELRRRLSLDTDL